MKHTGKNNPDHSALEQAISSIREVMTHINEDKRKTEGQMAMFDIFNEIDNCPVSIINSLIVSTSNFYYLYFGVKIIINKHLRAISRIIGRLLCYKLNVRKSEKKVAHFFIGALVRGIYNSNINFED